MIVRAVKWVNSCGPVVEAVQPESKRLLLTTLLIDLDGQEDLYLSYIDKAEAGETVLDLYNQLIAAELYPDGRVILEEMLRGGDDEVTGRASSTRVVQPPVIILHLGHARSRGDTK